MCPAKQSPHPLYIEKPSSDDDLEIIPIKGIDSHEQQPGCKRSLSSNTQSEKCLHFSKPHPHTVGFQSNVPQCTSPTTSTLQPEYHPMKRYESPTNIEQSQTKFSIFSERHPLTILFRSTVPQCTPPFTNPLSTEGHPMNKYELPITMERSEINNSTNDPNKEPHTAGFRPIVLQYTPSVGFTLPPECYPLKRSQTPSTIANPKNHFSTNTYRSARSISNSNVQSSESQVHSYDFNQTLPGHCSSTGLTLSPE